MDFGPFGAALEDAAVVELLLQLQATPLNPGLGAGQRDAQLLGDVLMGKSFDLGKKKRIPINRRHLFNKGPDALGNQFPVVLLFLFGRKIVRQLHGPLGSPVIVGDGVASDLIDPGNGLLLIPQGVLFLMNLQKELLKKIFRIAFVGNLAADECVKLGLMFLPDLLDVHSPLHLLVRVYLEIAGLERNPLINLTLFYMHESGILRCMRTTINIDDRTLERASHLTGVHEKTSIVRMGLQALIAQESARRLAQLGGTEKSLRRIPRSRSS